MSLGKSGSETPLRPGDVVEVRPAAEILASLDKDGTIKGMLFMPEMIAHVGKRYTVTRRVDKICNMVDETGSRRMQNTVYLDDLRCDGSAHGGCQAGCRIYWKEEWLRRVDENSTAPSTASKTGAAELERVAGAVTQVVREIDGIRTDTWRCQATDALKASKPLKQSDLRQYWRELRNGNFNPLRFTGLLIRAFLMDCAHQLGLLRTLPLRGPGEGELQGSRLNLQAGELVEVRTPKEIAATLDQRGENRRLSFDREMLPFCGHTFRVRERVDQIIDEKNGRMLKIPRDCIILDGVACSGERSVHGRWFCPRGIYPFWRESWLKRVEDAERS
jgi:hypothetical protein